MRIVACLLACTVLPTVASCADNFVVVSEIRTSEKQVLERRAEQLRDGVAEYWFGDTLRDWASPCRIVATSADSRRSHLTWTRKNGHAYAWKMNVHGSWGDVLDKALPHEVTHAVFESRFRRHGLPFWLSEAFAIAAEGPRSQQKYREDVRYRVDARRFLKFTDLLTLKQTSDTFREKSIYCEGYSLMEFLLEQKGKKTLLDFAWTLDSGGSTSDALRRYYGVSVPQLESLWFKWFQEQERRLVASVDTGEARRAFQCWQGYGPCQPYQSYQVMPSNNCQIYQGPTYRQQEQCQGCPPLRLNNPQTSTNPQRGPETWEPVRPLQPVTGNVAGRDEEPRAETRYERYDDSELREAVRLIREQLSGLNPQTNVEIPDELVAQLVATLFEQAVAAGRFKGEPGTNGDDGDDGDAATIDYDALAITLMPHIRGEITRLFREAVIAGELTGPAGSVDTDGLNGKITQVVDEKFRLLVPKVETRIKQRVDALRGSLRFRMSPVTGEPELVPSTSK